MSANDPKRTFRFNSKMFRAFTIFCLVFILTNCSYVPYLVLYNNSDEKITVCEINKEQAKCTEIVPKTYEKISLSSSSLDELDSYKIQTATRTFSYNFAFILGNPSEISSQYCDGLIWKRCNIAAQYESSGKIYHVGRDNLFPIKNLLDQPLNFPISPGYKCPLLAESRHAEVTITGKQVGNLKTT